MPEKYREDCEKIVMKLLCWVVLDDADGWATALATVCTVIDSIGALTGQNPVEIAELVAERVKEMNGGGKDE